MHILDISCSGETNFNVQKRLQGHMDIPLNEKGQKQAQAAGNALKDVKFHKAYSSDLSRANLTCQLILSKNEVSGIQVDEILQDQLIRERNFGQFEDKLVTEYEDECAAVNMKKYEYTPKNGESRDQVKSRAKDFIQVNYQKIENQVLTRIHLTRFLVAVKSTQFLARVQ